jgi:predicted ATPase
MSSELPIAYSEETKDPHDSRLIRDIQLTNLLSFGPTTERLELRNLNILIGPNASGKSNLIEAIDLLRATHGDLTAPIRKGGGIAEWLWKGSKQSPIAEIDATINYPSGIMPMRHRLSVAMVNQRLEIIDEAIENENRLGGLQDVFFFYRYQRGHPVLSVPTPDATATANGNSRAERRLRREDLIPDQSVLSQRKDPDQYPEITYLGNAYAKIRLYCEWNTGRYTAVRMPQKPDLPNDFLLENASNLNLVLNQLELKTGAWRQLMHHLTDFYGPVDRLSVNFQGGTVQLFLHETNLDQPIPATRLSDGTLRFLSLLTILCHPEPPPLICIEEPELGLHPDILPALADLLSEAAKKTQLIVTTHSDILVDALTDDPETIIVCEKIDGSTKLRRLDHDDLQVWLEKYSLGELWRRGDIGGNRW